MLLTGITVNFDLKMGSRLEVAYTYFTNLSFANTKLNSKIEESLLLFTYDHSNLFSVREVRCSK